MAPHGDEMAAPSIAQAAVDDHSGMDMSSMSGHDMGMMTIFFSATNTPLYSAAWTPANVGTYTATCLFLVALATLLRGLLALKALQEARWLDAELKRRYVVVAGKQGLGGQLESNGFGSKAVLSENGVEENVAVVERKKGMRRPWRLSVDPVRAVIDVVIAGIGYLLMLAVMSMNIGYFLSVLGGVFLGSILVGRYAVSMEH